jgi:hypothetical protein
MPATDDKFQIQNSFFSNYILRFLIFFLSFWLTFQKFGRLRKHHSFKNISKSLHNSARNFKKFSGFCSTKTSVKLRNFLAETNFYAVLRQMSEPKTLGCRKQSFGLKTRSFKLNSKNQNFSWKSRNYRIFFLQSASVTKSRNFILDCVLI